MDMAYIELHTKIVGVLKKMIFKILNHFQGVDEILFILFDFCFEKVLVTIKYL